MLSCLRCGTAGFKFNDQPFYQTLLKPVVYKGGPVVSRGGWRVRST